MKDLMKEVPWQFKVFWLVGVVSGLGLFGLVFYILFRVAQKL
jgi:F0F1-type ATP synthase membrane subunit c/vacuolar-type H+-ATPase subunit K